MHRRTGLVIFFIGLSWAAVLLLVQLGGDDREELLGTSIVASLFGLALAISPVGHAARWLVLAL
ncbi:MAG TPA: hypothetical protein VEA19_06995, partial [Actinomycetota bacterium]|nr:hypothetical protein [Actinomycetota bacterium]